MSGRDFWQTLILILAFSVLIGMIAGSKTASLTVGLVTWFIIESVLIFLLINRALKKEKDVE
jgi:hypothetical protein